MFPRMALGTAIIALMIAVHPAHLEAAQQNIHLVDQRGSQFAFENLRGAPIVLSFISAHCTDTCPLIDAQIARTVHRLGSSPLAVRFLTVTLDPERDSAADMHRIAHEFEAHSPRWIVASGHTADVHALMRRYGVEISRDSHGYATAHTSFIYILNPQLRVRRTLLASGDLAEQLFREVSQ
ncbi:MAG: SCO family protein [Candidatus Eremiobacteraeota bacterium]|nr:SCO family protein [Candidatus Eremiobacteraeota bacterium]